MAVTKGGADPDLCPCIDPAALTEKVPAGLGNGALKDRVERGRDERDMVLVAYLKSKVRDMDFGLIAPLIGADWSSDHPDLLFFFYLDRQVKLSKEEVRMEGEALVDHRDQILLYNYVSSGGGRKPDGNWVGLESLPNSISKVRTLATYCEQRLAARFSGRSSILAAIVDRVGGLLDSEGRSATVGAVLPVLPRLPHYLLFRDEEPEDGFDAGVKVLFDHHVLDFLDIESLVFSAERMADRLVELDS